MVQDHANKKKIKLTLSSCKIATKFRSFRIYDQILTVQGSIEPKIMLFQNCLYLIPHIPIKKYINHGVHKMVYEVGQVAKF